MAHSILVIAYHIIRDHAAYVDLEANYYDERNAELVQKRLIKHLENLGLKVTVEPLAVVT
ncbi:MAG TPA: hypothetical protein VHP83_10870 [Aggregatilineaceae bacterium]|nr:hypothetical protein [Aggregatilineaceae bacterium]